MALDRMKWRVGRALDGAFLGDGDYRSLPTGIIVDIDNNNYSAVERMIKTKERANLRLDPYFLRPLHRVLMTAENYGTEPVRQIKTKMVQYLLDKGADVNASYKGMKPIHMASRKDDPIVMKLLIDKGADFREKGRDGYTPLMASVELGLIENARVLLQNGADVNEKLPDDNTLLIAIIDDEKRTPKEKEKMINLLLDYGADPFIKDPDGSNAIGHAIHFSGIEGIEQKMKTRREEYIQKQKKPDAAPVAVLDAAPAAVLDAAPAGGRRTRRTRRRTKRRKTSKMSRN